MSKWLVTGAAGFIGSNIVKNLIEDGHRVCGIDNFSNGSRDNLKEFDQHKDQFIFYERDIREYGVCKFLCEQVDYVLHQAALVSVPRSIREPGIVNDTNVTGFFNMLRAAKAANIK